ncbi:MAG: MraY family glycosyltransferase [Planctomycetaceae bacterium]
MIIMMRLGVVDRPDGRRKLHGETVPLAGGLAIWFAIVIAVGASRFLGGPVLPGGDGRFWISFFAASGLLCLVGLADDVWNIRARHKLLGQLVAVGLLVMGSDLVIRSVELFGWHVELGVMSIPFTMFWLLGAINAMNLIDGMDGLAATVGGMIGIALAVMAAMSGHLAESTVAAALVGAVLGFLIYNFPPARVFLGDTGSMLIGLVLGVVAVRAALKGPATVALAAPVAIWTLPILDASMAILRRKLTGRGICIPDRGHLHHRLSDHGFSPRKSLLLIASLTAMTTAGAIASMVLKSEWIAPAVAIGVTAFLVTTRLFGHSEFALLARRTHIFLRSLIPWRHPHENAHEHRSRLQGTREWDDLWESLVTFAEQCRLDNVQLSVSLPVIHEEFFAGWHRRSPFDAGQGYRAEIPLTSPVFGSIGVLRIDGRCPNESACAWIGELIEGLRPFEIQIAELLASEAVDRPRAKAAPTRALIRVNRPDIARPERSTPKRGSVPVAGGAPLLAAPAGSAEIAVS